MKKRSRSYTFTLTADDNDFLRDYRFSEIMKTSDVTVSLRDIIIRIMQEYLDNLSHNTELCSKLKRKLDPNGPFMYRMSILLPETLYAELEKDRIQQALSSQTMDRLARGYYIHGILTFYRAYLEDSGYEIIHRPENVKEADRTKMLMSHFK